MVKTLAAVIVFLPAQSFAVPPMIGNCYPYDEVVAELAKADEASDDRTLVKSTQSGVEVFISKAGTLTVVEVMASGLTCYRAFNNGSPEHGAGWGAQPKNMAPM